MECKLKLEQYWVYPESVSIAVVIVLRETRRYTSEVFYSIDSIKRINSILRYLDT